MSGGSVDRDWYKTLQKPAWAPPPVVFGIVWPILYTLYMYVGYFIFKNNFKQHKQQTAIYLLVWVCNFIWLKKFSDNLDIQGTYVIGIMVVCLVWLRQGFSSYKNINTQHARAALVPFILWLCFAFFLSIKIRQLNTN